MRAATLCWPGFGLRASPIAEERRAPKIIRSLIRIRSAWPARGGRAGEADPRSPAPDRPQTARPGRGGTLGRPASSAAERARDRELLSRVAHGDVAALRTLYDEHAPRAMAIALRILRSAQEAEDIVQETFLELWRRARQFDAARGGAVAWVVTIARSRAIDRLRATGTADRAVAGAAAGEGLTPAPFPAPHAEAERRRDELRVASALSALPEEQRQTIELAYFEGLSQSEIAERTGSPLGTVKMRVKLAIAKLSRLLKEDEE
jgi:RNA polymerase sigma-70 factor (ECF subfamily)